MEELEKALRAAVPRGEREALARATGRFSARAGRLGLADVAFATVDSPLGSLVVAATRIGLVRLAYGEESTEAVLEELSARISPRVLEIPSLLDEPRRELDQYFEGTRREFALPVDWSMAGVFQRRVLEATATIPYGQVASYREVAAKTGSPNAARAAGNALGANPIPIVVPCHRVVHASGGLGGYTGGLARKRFLLRLEGEPSEAPRWS